MMDRERANYLAQVGFLDDKQDFIFKMICGMARGDSMIFSFFGSH